MKSIYLFYKFIFFNKKISNYKKLNEDKILLVELYNIKATILSFSLFTRAYKKLYGYRLVGYLPTFQSKKKKTKNFILNLFSFFNYFGLYKSFGVHEFIFPTTDNLNLSKIKKLSKYLLKDIKDKKDILKLKIEGILIGDIFYDTYLREKDLITVDIKSKNFKKFFENSVALFFYWHNYLQNKKIQAVVVSHSVYLTALPARIAIQLNKKAFAVAYHSVFQLTNKEPLVWGGFREYPKEFKILSKSKQKKSILEAKKLLGKRFRGEKDHLYKISNSINVQTFLKNKKNKTNVLKKNNKIKVLIAAHDFTDAVHGMGDMIFEDMYEWIKFLINFSKKKNYDWYIKLHPAEYDLNLHKMKNLLKGFNDFLILPNNVSHTQLIDEGINCALTVFGSIGHEYPYFGVPVINAGDNPHLGYNFNFHPKNKEEYTKLLNRINKLKIPKNSKKKIYEFYYMKFMQDFNILPNINSIEHLNSSIIFKDYVSNKNKKNLKAINYYKNFITMNKRRLIVD
jgi:hypothetical protein